MLTHTDSQGKASMVDVSPKPPMLRQAEAFGFIRLQTETIELVRNNLIKKGDVLTVAEIAGIQAAKLTPQLIPLCHPLLLSHVEVKAVLTDEGVEIRSKVVCTGPTGVEMEALTAVQVGLLTIYDMCKAVDKQMEISRVHLVSKTKTEV
ncbi:MAG: cyclic pyranopterin monophosphate synthase MoaC [Bacteroidales bacterium]